jgi:hypothetical protein
MLSFGYLIIDSPAACGHTSCPSSQILSKVQVGSCEEVKVYTRSMNNNPSLHRVQCFGLIDMDGLDEKQINCLLSDNIYVLPVAIIENIFLLPSIARHIFRITGEDLNFDEGEFTKSVIDWIEVDENWKSKSVKQKIINSYVSVIGQLPSKIQDLSACCTNSIQSIDPQKHIHDFERAYQDARLSAIGQQHPKPLLKLCRGKHLLPELAKKLGLASRKSLELKILNTIDRDKDLLSALRKELPNIPYRQSI